MSVILYTQIRTCIDILDIKLQHNFKAVHLLQQCCLPNISTIMNNRHINDTIDTYKDMNKYFGDQAATELPGCHLLQQCCLLNISTTMNDRGIKHYLMIKFFDRGHKVKNYLFSILADTCSYGVWWHQK